MRLYETKGTKLDTNKIDKAIKNLQDTRAELKTLAYEVQTFCEGEGWNIEYFEIDKHENGDSYGLYIQIKEFGKFWAFIFPEGNEVWIETEFNGTAAKRTNYLKDIKRLTKVAWKERPGELYYDEN